MVDSPERQSAKDRAPSPADARTAATQTPATVSTTDNAKTVLRAATGGAGRAVRQVRCEV